MQKSSTIGNELPDAKNNPQVENRLEKMEKNWKKKRRKIGIVKGQQSDELFAGCQQLYRSEEDRNNLS